MFSEQSGVLQNLFCDAEFGLSCWWFCSMYKKRRVLDSAAVRMWSWASLYHLSLRLRLQCKARHPLETELHKPNLKTWKAGMTHSEGMIDTYIWKEFHRVMFHNSPSRTHHGIQQKSGLKKRKNRCSNKHYKFSIFYKKIPIIYAIPICSSLHLC